MKVTVQCRVKGMWMLRVAPWVCRAILLFHLPATWAEAVVRWALNHVRIQLRVGKEGWTTHRLSKMVSVEDVVGRAA